jgi:hypothetical protein
MPPMAEIDALLKEHRTFPPSDEWRARAVASDPSVYEHAARDPEGFWSAFASQLEWMRPWNEVLRWTPPDAQWFVGGKLNASVNCVDRHVRTARRNRAALIWEGEPGDRRTLTYWDLFRQVSAFANVLKSLGVEARRPDRAVPAAHPRAGHRDARVRPDRRRPQRGLRRLQRRVAPRPHQRRAGRAARHRRRRLPPRADRAPQADGRRGSRTRRPSRTSSSCSARPARHSRGRAGRARPLVPPPDAARLGRLPARGDGQRGHALHPLHVRHDGEAEGHRPHDRRLSGRHVRHHAVGLRPEGRRRLLVHRRHRLGHGPQLRRLRAARQRRDGADVRGRARLAAEGPLLGAHRAPRRHDLLHRADGHPCVHALGDRLARPPRPRFAAPARLGGSRSTPKPGCGTTSTSARNAARSSTPGGRPRPA